MYGTIQQHLQQELENIREAGLFKAERIISSPQEAEITLESGETVLNFCANNYLGLANHPDVVAAFHQGLDRFGAGSGAAHLITGHSRAHHELEAALADFVQRPRALLFSTGGAAINVLDLDSGEARPSTLNDLYHLGRLVDALDHIHFFLRPCIPTDIPEEAYDVNMYYACLKEYGG